MLRTLVLWGDGWKAGVHVDPQPGIATSASSWPTSTSWDQQRCSSLRPACAWPGSSAVENNLAVNYAPHTDRRRSDHRPRAERRGPVALGHQSRWQFQHLRRFSYTGAHVFLYELQLIRREIAEQFHQDFAEQGFHAVDPLAFSSVDRCSVVTLTRRFGWL